MAGKGVLLEGLEVVLIVAALGAGEDGLAPALAGAAVAVVAVIAIGVVAHRPLARLPESHLKYAVGVVLSAFGVFFLAEGLGVEWPGGDVALLYVAAALVAVSQLAGHDARTRGPGVIAQLRKLVLGETWALPLGIAAHAARRPRAGCRRAGVVAPGGRLRPARRRARDARRVAAPALTQAEP